MLTWARIIGAAVIAIGLFYVSRGIIDEDEFWTGLGSVEVGLGVLLLFL